MTRWHRHGTPTEAQMQQEILQYITLDVILANGYYIILYLGNNESSLDKSNTMSVWLSRNNAGLSIDSDQS